MPITLDGTNGITLTGSAADVTLSNTSPLGTASAGTMEYDGTVPYFTPLGTQRGLIPGMQYLRLMITHTGSNSSAAQNLLPAAVTLSSNTTYAFESLYYITKSAGATSHTFGLLMGGTCTAHGIGYTVYSAQSSSATNNIAAKSSLLGSMTPRVAVNDAIANGTVYHWINTFGTISVNVGGTLMPQYQLSAAPGGAYSTNYGSYFLIYPIGAGTSNNDISIGTWT